MKFLLVLVFFLTGMSAFAQSYYTVGQAAPVWKSAVPNVGALPAAGNTLGDTRVTLATFGIYVWDGAAWQPAAGGGGGAGTVTSVSVVSANGFAGTVATATTTPAITISTSVNGLLKGNGTAVSAAVAGTDYQAPISTSTAPANQFATGFTAPNTFTYAQPSFANLSGSVTAAQMLALPNGNIYIGDGSNQPAPQVMSGGASISSAGVVTLSNAAVIGQALTGFVASAGAVTAADSILTAFQKVVGNAASSLSSALTTNHIFVGSAGSIATDVAMSGDASIVASGALTVNTVGASSAANIHSAELLANAATNVNTASTIVRRDASGDFSAGTITATLNGNATNVTGVVAVANGGTSLSTLTANALVVGNGAAAPSFLSPSTVGNVVISNGTNFVSQSALETGIFHIAKNGANSAACGSAVAPCLTIQQALSNFGDAANAADVKRPGSFYIAPGAYDESLTIPNGRIITLFAQGTVVLGDGAGANWASTTPRSINWAVNTAAVFGSDIKPALNLIALPASDATSTFIAEAGNFTVSGNLAMTGDGLTNTLNLNGVKIWGNVTHVNTALTNWQSYRSIVVGTVTTTGNLVLERAYDSRFNGLLSVNAINMVFNSNFPAGITVQSIQQNLLPNGIFHSNIAGTFTGPAGSARFDPETDFYFTNNAAALAGGATKVLLANNASATVTGLLSSADWSTFNSKQAAISTSTAPANQFATGFTAPNTFTYAQPAFSNLSGSISAAQMLALPTNDIYVGNGSNQSAAVAVSGDVSNVAGAFTVNTVGASSAANIHSAELLANAATAANTPSRIVLRDGAGSFSSQDISLSGTLKVPTIIDAASTVSVHIDNRQLLFPGGGTSVDWLNMAIYDVTAVASIDWGNRLLIDSTGAIALDYSANGTIQSSADINMNSHFVHGVTDPAVAQDAATKNYVDTQVPTEKVSTKVANYTVLLSDQNLIGDTSGGTFTFTLPTSASAFSGGRSSVFVFLKSDSSANLLSIATQGGDTIQGVASVDLNTQYQSITVITDGTGAFYVK